MSKGARIRAQRKSRAGNPRFDTRLFGQPLEDGEDDLVVIFTEDEVDRYDPPIPLMNSPMYHGWKAVRTSRGEPIFREISATDYYTRHPSRLDPEHRAELLRRSQMIADALRDRLGADTT
jgi:hypothetical protein